MEQNTYIYLKTLKDSDFQIVDGQPNIIGWETKNELGVYVGKVKDLLFDPQTNSVRYMIIDLEDNGMSLGNKKVMIPIGIAHLHTTDDEVVLPNVHQEQFSALPNYNEEEIGSDIEVQVREIIGSPAALRIEEKIVEFDQQQFYAHQHFDSDHFYQRGGDPNRQQQEETIHDLVENSKAHGLNAANAETGNNTHHNEHTIKPWLNTDDNSANEDPDFLERKNNPAI